MDVDNLGKVFARGFKKELRSFSRLTSLSRHLTLFFKFYINSICQGNSGNNVKPLDLSGKLLTKNESRNLSIVYSGGDDLFLVGAWDEITEIAFDIHNSFKLYTCQNPDVNISGGIIVQRENFPLYLLAKFADKAEKLAKDSNRNKITLFYNPTIETKRKGAKNPIKQTFDWENIEEEVLTFMRAFKAIGKIRKDENRFEPGFAHGFLHRLFVIFEEWERRGVMYLPRMGYTYKRLQETLSKGKETPELKNLRTILMDKEKIMNLRTSLIWIELLSRRKEKI